LTFLLKKTIVETSLAMSLKVSASNEEFSVAGVEAMSKHIVDDVLDAGTSSKGLFPFRGNTTHQACWVMTVSFPVHKKVEQLTRSMTRGGGGTRGSDDVAPSRNVDPTGFYYPVMEYGDAIKRVEPLPL